MDKPHGRKIAAPRAGAFNGEVRPVQDDTTETPVGHSTNLVGLPTRLLASAAWNDQPIDLHINGVREMNPQFFEMLGRAEDLEDAARALHLYMQAIFGLEPEQQERVPDKRDSVRRFRSSYLRLLKGWSYDSNAREGAVLRGWVESRFGLLPTFHKEPIMRFSSHAWMTYVEEKMSSRFHNNAIYTQLDIMYEFCQWALRRFVVAKGSRHITLYRGVNDFAEHPVVERRSKREVVVRMNNLMSFSSERDIAECFGDTILEARVPLSKVVFFNTLLPIHPLKGEGEFLVVGGDFLVTASYY
ncbi:MAG: NAD(+)--dinitrogen-reductase ADP-D-ribosyltransferase [Rhodospirillaceae bacterium BRH_c57]|nr:MAG: NAD(+)--dinitrogen-reductase ADP-D-ribosyltransferase [Rhodospirillaceae bacterium BRH_c57]